jgi:hypothetical protein
MNIFDLRRMKSIYDIIYIARKLRYAGPVARTDETRNAYRNFVKKTVENVHL